MMSPLLMSQPPPEECLEDRNYHVSRALELTCLTGGH
jgi:hypothetical protein